MAIKSAVAVLMLALAHTAPVAADSDLGPALQSEALVRTVPYERGQDLRSRVEKGNLEVTIERSWLSPDLNVPNGVDLVEWRTTLYPVILLVHVIKVTGSEGPARDWITSLIEATVTDVLKNTTHLPLANRDRVVFGVSGGEVSVNGTRVIARFSGVEQFRASNTYLVFGVVRSDGSLHVSPDSAYVLEGERFLGLDKTNKNDAIDRLSDKTAVLEKLARGISK